MKRVNYRYVLRGLGLGLLLSITNCNKINSYKIKQQMLQPCGREMEFLIDYSRRKAASPKKINNLFPLDLCNLIERYAWIRCSACKYKNKETLALCLLCKVPFSNNTTASKHSYNYECLKTLEGHTNAISSLSNLGEGLLASGSWDKTIKVWDMRTGESKTLKGHTDGVSSLSNLGENKLASGSLDKTIKLWDIRTGKSETLKGHTDWVKSLSNLGEGKLASGSFDKTIKVWDIRTGESETLKGHTDWVKNLSNLGEGKLASGSYETIKIWDIRTGKSETIELEGYTDWVNSLLNLGEGKLASGSDDNTIKIWG